MSDDVSLPTTYLSADKIDYARQSIVSQSEPNSRMSQSYTFFHALCLVKSYLGQSDLIVAHSRLNILSQIFIVVIVFIWHNIHRTCILSRRKRTVFKNFLGVNPKTPHPLYAKFFNRGLFRLSFTNIHKLELQNWASTKEE